MAEETGGTGLSNSPGFLRVLEELFKRKSLYSLEKEAASLPRGPAHYYPTRDSFFPLLNQTNWTNENPEVLKRLNGGQY